MVGLTFVAIGTFILAFLLGSIPWGVIISRFAFHKDIRNYGSGNIGTTNAMRSLGKVGGGAVFVLDFGKGVFAGYIASLISAALPSWATDPWHALIMGAAFLGCVWGHVFSPWLGFKGGKGIAVAAGALVFVCGWQVFLMEIALFAVLVVVTRYVSVGSVAAAVLCPFAGLYCYWGDWACVVLITVAAITVIWAHRENLGRLRAGTENRVGSKKKAAQAG